MFPADTADFYQIFLHIKQIIRPSESQPYITKQEKGINFVQQKYWQYQYQIYSILAITNIFTKNLCTSMSLQCYHNTRMK